MLRIWKHNPGCFWPSILSKETSWNGIYHDGFNDVMFGTEHAFQFVELKFLFRETKICCKYDLFLSLDRHLWWRFYASIWCKSQRLSFDWSPHVESCIGLVAKAQVLQMSQIGPKGDKFGTFQEVKLVKFDYRVIIIKFKDIYKKVM